MADLDGLWSVERVSGFLPPMLGVRKRIAGSTGETTLGGLPGAGFAVEGLVLRYRAPLSGLVDVLEPDEGGYRGRTTYRGRQLGRFRMRRIEERGADMASNELEAQLVRHIDEAIAMEQTVLRMLDSMVSTTQDEEIKDELRLHKLETEKQLDRLTQRLKAHGASPSLVREAGGITGALLKGVVDAVRGQKAARNARDGYATEHLEIAAYQLLERVAQRAGDEETAEVARQNRAEEEAMAARIDANWDRYAELALEEAGITH
jgi:ferritin-like metal-binding protein YciE